MATTHYELTFELKNSKILEMTFDVSVYSCGYWQPPEVEESEPDVTIDGELFEDWCKLPKGLQHVAECMYADECPPHWNVTKRTEEFKGERYDD